MKDKDIDLFDQDELRSYNFEFDDGYWAMLQNSKLEETYVPCKVTTNYGTPEAATFKKTGCRYKGSVGSLRICFNEQGVNDWCRKLSFKVDANEFRDDKQRIYGLKKLNFHGMPTDKSLMRERVSYYMYDKAGTPAPRAVHAKLFVNGTYHGIFTLVEQLDDRFTKSHFSDDKNKGKGGLYKHPFWPSIKDPEFAKSCHENGEDETEWLGEVADAIAAADVATDAKKIIDKYFDLESIIKVTAISDLVATWDDWRNSFNNQLWYVKDGKDGKKLVMIPWDMDNSLSANVFAGAFRWDEPMSAEELATKCDGSLDNQIAKKVAAADGADGNIPADYGVPDLCICYDPTKAADCVEASTSECMSNMDLEYCSVCTATPDAPECQAEFMKHLATVDCTLDENMLNRWVQARVAKAAALLPRGSIPDHTPFRCDKLAQMIAKVAGKDVTKQAKKYVKGFAKTSKLLKFIDKVDSQIADAVADDPDDFGAQVWEEAKDDIRNFLTAAAKELGKPCDEMELKVGCQEI